jgi:hypothetical protein
VQERFPGWQEPEEAGNVGGGLYFFAPQISSFEHDYLVEWAIALHGMYESMSLIIYNFKYLTCFTQQAGTHMR